MVSAIEVPGAGGAPQGDTGIEVANVGPWPGDSAENLPQDLVVHGLGAGVSRSVALSDATLARVLEHHRSDGI
jgi:hypothetical protein